MKKGTKVLNNANLTPQKVLDELSKYIDVSFISMDQNREWFVWQFRPSVMIQSKGWFSPGSYIAIKNALLLPEKDWKNSLYCKKQCTHKEET